ncbi:hypothetical protein COO60DRAFT_1502261 [Scenedesmus sp. NREL 46B-D3]|nr:hypothetical protein COO60DRAFT_1502261 [Scenedesmus sp. NREL 46B-D3]
MCANLGLSGSSSSVDHRNPCCKLLSPLPQVGCMGNVVGGVELLCLRYVSVSACIALAAGGCAGWQLMGCVTTLRHHTSYSRKGRECTLLPGSTQTLKACRGIVVAGDCGREEEGRVAVIRVQPARCLPLCKVLVGASCCWKKPASLVNGWHFIVIRPGARVAWLRPHCPFTGHFLPCGAVVEFLTASVPFDCCSGCKEGLALAVNAAGKGTLHHVQLYVFEAAGSWALLINDCIILSGGQLGIQLAVHCHSLSIEALQAAGSC